MKGMIITILVFIAGCSTIEQTEKHMIIYGYDFTPYSAKGFLFTPKSYDGEYSSIGLIEVDLYPEVIITESKSKDDTWQRPEDHIKVDQITASEILDSLYSVAIRMGADALTNLEITSLTYYPRNEQEKKSLRASGFAIKRIHSH